MGNAKYPNIINSKLTKINKTNHRDHDDRTRRIDPKSSQSIYSSDHYKITVMRRLQYLHDDCNTITKLGHKRKIPATEYHRTA